MPYAVQDAMATVLEVHETAYDASALDYCHRPEQHGEVMLDMLPVAVLVNIDACDDVFARARRAHVTRSGLRHANPAEQSEIN
jgi:hypothetical protein